MFLKSHYKSGEWNALCDVCGLKYKSSELQKRWDGMMVCKQDYEVRHPQDYMRGPRGEKGIPWSRPEPADRFVTVDYISTSTGVQDTTIPSGHNNGAL